MPTSRHSRSRRGFSVLEILITVIVVGIALVPLLLSLKTSTRTVAGTRDYLAAVAFAQLALEELRNTAFRPPAQAAASSIPTLDACVKTLNTAKKTLVENGVQFERAVSLFPDSVANLQPGSPDLVTVQVVVRWKPPGGFLSSNQEYRLFSTLGSATQP